MWTRSTADPKIVELVYKALFETSKPQLRTTKRLYQHRNLKTHPWDKINDALAQLKDDGNLHSANGIWHIIKRRSFDTS